MDHFIIQVFIGLVIGTFGTLIGAGGGFLLVPLLLLTHPNMQPEVVTAISLAIVALNSISGSVAYARSGLIDYKAGFTFAAFTIPGSIIGVGLTSYIPTHLFNLVFGILLILLSTYLFVNNNPKILIDSELLKPKKGYKLQTITDKNGNTYTYQYNYVAGIIVSVLVGFLSPLFGIGGGIIHVPAMVQWLQFPVYIATATSHFILAIMSLVSVGVHLLQGNYNEAGVLKMVAAFSIGVIPGAQIGAYLSHKIKSATIIRILAICLALVGARILLNAIHI